MNVFERIGKWFSNLFGSKPKRKPGLHVKPPAMEARVRDAMRDVASKTRLTYNPQWEIRVTFTTRSTTTFSRTAGRQVAVLSNGRSVGVASWVNGYVGIELAVCADGYVPQWAVEHEMAHAISAVNGLGMTHRPEWKHHFVGWQD